MNETLVVYPNHSVGIHWDNNRCSSIKSLNDYLQLLDNTGVEYKRTENLVFDYDDEGFSVRYGQSNGQDVKDKILFYKKNFLNDNSNFEISISLDYAYTYFVIFYLFNDDFKDLFEVFTMEDANYPQNFEYVRILSNNRQKLIDRNKTGLINYSFNLKEYNPNANFSDYKYFGFSCLYTHYYSGSRYPTCKCLIRKLIID